MGNKNNPIQFGQMVLTDRVAIEVGIAKKQTFEKIGKTIGRSPVTVAREIKANRTKLPPEYPFGNDCKLARHCEKKHMCVITVIIVQSVKRHVITTTQSMLMPLSLEGALAVEKASD